MILDERGRVDADRLGDLGTQGIGDLLGLSVRSVNADESGRVATAAAQTPGRFPLVAEADEPRHLRPVGAVEQPEIRRRASIGPDQRRSRGLFQRQAPPEVAADVDPLEHRSDRGSRPDGLAGAAGEILGQIRPAVGPMEASQVPEAIADQVAQACRVCVLAGGLPRPERAGGQRAHLRDHHDRLTGSEPRSHAVQAVHQRRRGLGRGAARAASSRSAQSGTARPSGGIHGDVPVMSVEEDQDTSNRPARQVRPDRTRVPEPDGRCEGSLLREDQGRELVDGEVVSARIGCRLHGSAGIIAPGCEPAADPEGQAAEDSPARRMLCSQAFG